MSIWICPYGQAVKTPPSHGGNRGSIPRRGAMQRLACEPKKEKSRRTLLFFFVKLHRLFIYDLLGIVRKCGSLCSQHDFVAYPIPRRGAKKRRSQVASSFFMTNSEILSIMTRSVYNASRASLNYGSLRSHYSNCVAL